jgi:hypothetical protein
MPALTMRCIKVPPHSTRFVTVDLQNPFFTLFTLEKISPVFATLARKQGGTFLS